MASPLTLRDHVVIAAFGAFGGAVEISLGSLAHALPVLPFKGLLLAMIMTMVIAAAWVYLDGHPRVPFYTGAVMAFLKLLSVGGALLIPMIAILLETAVIGFILWMSRPERSTGPMISGVAVAFFTVVHRLVVQIVLYGQGILDVYISLLDSMNRILGQTGRYALWMLVPVAVIHVAAGLVFGYQGWIMGRYFRKVLQR